MSNIQFHELKKDTQYKMYFGDRTHNYVYEMRNGRLYNISNSKFSDVAYSNAIRFKELETPKKMKYKSLEFNIEYFKNECIIGCQTVSKADMIAIAEDICEQFNIDIKG